MAAQQTYGSADRLKQKNNPNRNEKRRGNQRKKRKAVATLRQRNPARIQKRQSENREGVFLRLLPRCLLHLRQALPAERQVRNGLLFACPRILSVSLRTPVQASYRPQAGHVAEDLDGKRVPLSAARQAEGLGEGTPLREFRGETGEPPNAVRRVRQPVRAGAIPHDRGYRQHLLRPRQQERHNPQDALHRGVQGQRRCPAAGHDGICRYAALPEDDARRGDTLFQGILRCFGIRRQRISLHGAARRVYVKLRRNSRL